MERDLMRGTMRGTDKMKTAEEQQVDKWVSPPQLERAPPLSSSSTRFLSCGPPRYHRPVEFLLLAAGRFHHCHIRITNPRHTIKHVVVDTHRKCAIFILDK
jgi:hypothetical protein